MLAVSVAEFVADNSSVDTTNCDADIGSKCCAVDASDYSAHVCGRQSNTGADFESISIAKRAADGSAESCPEFGS